MSPTRQRQSSKNPSQTRKGFQCDNLAYQGAQDGASKSNLRLQLGKMKKREKDLEVQIIAKDSKTHLFFFIINNWTYEILLFIKPHQ